VLEGWRDTRALLTFGTPYAGSMNAVDTLVNGSEKFGISLTDVSRRMNSLHQLLPTYRCCDTGDGTLKRLQDVPQLTIDSRRLANAVSFHDEIRSAAEENSKDDEYRKSQYGIYPIVGLRQPTRQSLRVHDGGVELLQTLLDKSPGGDGTVPRQSAVPEGFRISHAMFAPAKHGQLQNHSPALAHISGVVTSLYLPDVFRRGGSLLPVEVSLELDDIHWAPTQVPIRAKPSEEGTPLLVTITDRSGRSQEKRAEMMPQDAGWLQYTFRPPHEGKYSVLISGEENRVAEVRDVFEVVDQRLT